jgi:hypothetical protein
MVVRFVRRSVSPLHLHLLSLLYCSAVLSAYIQTASTQYRVNTKARNAQHSNKDKVDCDFVRGSARTRWCVGMAGRWMLSFHFVVCLLHRCRFPSQSSYLNLTQSAPTKTRLTRTGPNRHIAPGASGFRIPKNVVHVALFDVCIPLIHSLGEASYQASALQVHVLFAQGRHPDRE